MKMVSCLVVSLVASCALAAEQIDYARQIKPILASRCYQCHGAFKQESELRLDTGSLIRQGGASGPAIVPASAAESLLVRRITSTDDEFRMPAEGEPLTDDQIALITLWIDQGARTPAGERGDKDPRDYWALQPVVRPPVPEIAGDWVGNPIDAFLERERHERGLTARGPAPPHVLVRRVYLDLTGLPPTRDQLREFLNDTSPDAYEQVVDHLLESPGYGERWGRHWMDVWRYSDWAGWNEQVRDSQPHIWRWRDWIVKSLNDDKPYDRMIVEMLAGDELAPTDPDVLAATGFLVRNYKMLSREKWMQDTVDHTAQALLGLTLKCARCHNHMYDPISQEDFYRFRAVFEPHNVRIDRVTGQLDTQKDGLPRVFDAELSAATYVFIRGDDRMPDKDHPIEPGVPAIFGDDAFCAEPVELAREAFYPDWRSGVREQLVRAAREKVAKAQQEVDNSSLTQGAATATPLPAKRLAAAEAELGALVARIEAEQAKFQQPPAENTLELAKRAALAERQEAVARAEAGVAQVQYELDQAPNQESEQKRREELQAKLEKANQDLAAANKALESPGEQYSPLGPVYPQQSSGRRLALARWIASTDNPFTARVAVNHIWLRHFGQALVPSVFDFGANGKPPTHPELLDWLAAEFMQPTLVQHSTSGTPRREPAANAAPSAWSMKHIHRLIVTSAAYRMASSTEETSAAIDPDNLYLWRMASRRMEAELVRDSVLHVAGELDTTIGGPDLDYHDGFKIKRRSLYFRHAPEKQMQFLKLFDAAAPTECYQRKESVVPQQALALANSALTLENARLLARKLADDCGEDAQAFVTDAFQQVLARPATPAEVETSVEFLSQQSKFFAENRAHLTVAAENSTDASKPSRDPTIRARENLVHVLFNHNDFVTIR
jgi:hypothetical protein